MVIKNKEELNVGQRIEKLTPAFLQPDYPYQPIGGALKIEEVEDGIVYEIKCHTCEMSIRSQGQNIRSVWNRLIDRCCIGCGNKKLVIRKMDMSEADTGLLCMTSNAKESREDNNNA